MPLRTYARIENGSEVEQIVLRDGAAVPAGDWRPVVVEGLDFDRAAFRELPGRATRIDPDKVARVVQIEPIPGPTIDDVVAERERRLSLGFDYDFGDARGVHRIGTTEADMKGWEEVDKAASALIALGMGSQTLSVVTDTGPAVVTAIEWKQIILAATLHRQPIWAKSFTLQAMTPIPADYATDSYWSI